MKLNRIDAGLLGVLMLAFWVCVLRQVDLPGLYMDGVNPDYLAAKTLFPALANPDWTVPRSVFPLLGSLYHGVQNYYLDLGVFRLLGISVTSIRIAQALFGAATVALLYVLTLRATGNRVGAFIGAALLATDIAFIASFRTQFYIILGGQTWLFASLYCLWRGQKASFFLSGIFFGLAVYGYFVLGFFGPALVLIVLSRPDRRFLLWSVGVVVGLLPYAAGYLSLAVQLGGYQQTREWLRAMTNGLAPLSSHLTFGETINYTANLAWLGLSNAGNELMIFTRPVSGAWASVKIAAFGLAFLAVGSMIRRDRAWVLALLPVSYFGIALIFGSRLWAHHFGVFVATAYLLVAVAISRFATTRARSIVAGCLAGVFLLGNIHQSNNFYRSLDATGGVKLTTDALNRLAADAMSEPGVLYVFPDWGFFMGFNLLTQNKVPFVLDANVISQVRNNSPTVAIAFWSLDDEAKYVDLLKRNGASTTETRIYRRRDGLPAFQVVFGHFGATAVLPGTVH